MLILKNIIQNYKQGDEVIKVLDNLNLTLKKNKIIGLIGSSGSGKSTLLNIIGLIEIPLSGNIEINEVRCDKLDSEEKTHFRRKNIGYVFQNNQLLEDFNCEENVALPLILDGISHIESIRKSRYLLKKFNLDNRRSFKPSLLSGGEQQRVAVLRALIKKPKILLADEPTGSLDKKNSLIVLEQILELVTEQNTISIIATHNLDLISYFDICFKIEKGKLVEFK